jgi:predicted metal-dependent hydrolase
MPTGRCKLPKNRCRCVAGKLAYTDVALSGTVTENQIILLRHKRQCRIHLPGSMASNREADGRKKGDRIRVLLQNLSGPVNPAQDPLYLGYFWLFNERKYYEAHDILEHLWLNTSGARYRYFKGLIQFAGAFVHLKKHHERPDHPVDKRRLAPAWRLLRLAQTNLRPYAPAYLGFDVRAALSLAQTYRTLLETSQFQENPWDPKHPPQLEPPTQVRH